MNNKFIKRVAAVVLGVAVLSTCAFATELLDGSYINGTKSLVFEYAAPESADKVSYVAYTATEGTGVDAVNGGTYTLSDNIVAIGQDDAATVDPKTVPTITVNADLLAKDPGATHIVVASGDSAGSDATYYALEIADFTASKEFVNADNLTVEIDGKTFTDCPNFSVSITPKKAGSVTLAGANIVYNGEPVAAEVVQPIPAIECTAGTPLELLNILIAGIPDDFDATKLEVTPVIDFK